MGWLLHGPNNSFSGAGHNPCAGGTIIFPGQEDHPAPPLTPPTGAGDAGTGTLMSCSHEGWACSWVGCCRCQQNKHTTNQTKGLKEAMPITSNALLPHPAQTPPPRGWAADGRQAHGESCRHLPFTVSEVPKPREMGNLNKTKQHRWALKRLAHHR